MISAKWNECQSGEADQVETGAGCIMGNQCKCIAAYCRIANKASGCCSRLAIRLVAVAAYLVPAMILLRAGAIFAAAPCLLANSLRYLVNLAFYLTAKTDRFLVGSKESRK